MMEDNKKGNESTKLIINGEKINNKTLEELSNNKGEDEDE